VERNALLLVVFGAAALVLLAGVAPFLLLTDFWLNLVAGREIAEHGLPHEDTLTIFAQGREWVDQQWLAHVCLYSLVRLGGLPLATVTAVAVVLGAFGLAAAAARWRGATQRATVIVAFVALLAAPWAFAVRAQTLALPLFVATVWLLIDARERLRSRTFLVIPILVLWANVHGSVVVGAVLVVWLAAEQVIRRGRQALAASTLLAALAVASVFATPYGPAATYRYYDRTLIDPQFADLVTEWQRPSPNVLTAGFFVLAVAAIPLLIWQRRRLSRFELGAIALTLAGALSSLRGVVWFVLMALICLPAALDAAARLRDAPVDIRLNRAVAGGVAAAVMAVAALVPVRGEAWLESEWPRGMLGPLGRATGPADTRVWATDRTSDWLLWHHPEVRGRIAYDVRFELLTRRQIRAIGRYNSEAGPNWKAATTGFRVIVVNAGDSPSHLGDYLAERGTRLVYRDRRAALFVRRLSS
jgi:hypothetical protein